MSNTLTDIYNSISDRDAEYLEKHAAQIKIAEEEDAAGRITARGFADELHKLAQEVVAPTKLPKPPKVEGGGIKAEYKVGGGQTGPSGPAQGRPVKAPPVKDISKGKGSFTPGASIGGSGQIQKRPPVTPGS